MRKTTTAKDRTHRRCPARLLALLASGIVLWVMSAPLGAQEGTRQMTRQPSGPSRARGNPSPPPRDASPRPPSGGSGGTNSSPTTGGHRGGGYGGHHGYGHRGSHRYYGYSHYRYPYYSFYYPYYRYPYYSYGYRAPSYYGSYSRYAYSEYGLGALDLDVRPKKAEVYLDGNYIGVVDKYDGFPRYLWLEKGTYEIAFYKDGYETVSRQVKVYPGVVIDIKDRLVPGSSVRPEPPPESAAAKPQDRGYGEPGSAPERRAWQRRREADEGYEERGRPRPLPERSPEAPPADLRSEPAHLRLSVHPADVSVYLDGRLLGSGEELARLHAPLILDPGEHVLEAVRPGYRSKEVRFEAEAGEEVELDIELETQE